MLAAGDFSKMVVILNFPRFKVFDVMIGERGKFWLKLLKFERPWTCKGYFEGPLGLGEV